MKNPGRLGRGSFFHCLVFELVAVATAATAAAVAAAATATAATATGARTLFTRASLVDRQGAALEHRAVHGGDRLVGTVAHLHEPEAARPTRVAIHYDRGPSHRAVLGELLLEVGLGCLER